MSIFKKRDKKLNKYQDYVLNIHNIVKHKDVMFLRIDIFPDLSGIIEIYRNDGEVSKLHVRNIKSMQ